MKGHTVLKITKINKDTFEVVVQSTTTTQHIVKVSDKVLTEFTFNQLSKEQFLKKSFLFLLRKEPNTSIEGDFNIEEIENFFPEFRNIYKVDWVNINI
mgnify:CR=1 FL=1